VACAVWRGRGGARFTGPGRWRRGGEAAGGGGILILIGFEGVKGEEETGQHRFGGGVKAVRRRFGLAPRARGRAVAARAS
jgi:hypothetical protein